MSAILSFTSRSVAVSPLKLPSASHALTPIELSAVAAFLLVPSKRSITELSAVPASAPLRPRFATRPRSVADSLKSTSSILNVPDKSLYVVRSCSMLVELLFCAAVSTFRNSSASSAPLPYEVREFATASATVARLILPASDAFTIGFKDDSICSVL